MYHLIYFRIFLLKKMVHRVVIVKKIYYIDILQQTAHWFGMSVSMCVAVFKNIYKKMNAIHIGVFIRCECSQAVI